MIEEYPNYKGHKGGFIAKALDAYRLAFRLALVDGFRAGRHGTRARRSAKPYTWKHGPSGKFVFDEVVL